MAMLRVHLMQNWFGYSDPAMEEALYEIGSMRAFAKLSLARTIPDETTILNFRRRIEENDLEGPADYAPFRPAGQLAFLALAVVATAYAFAARRSFDLGRTA